MDDDEILGDEEMLQYIKRQQARKLANGVKKEDLDEMFSFPEPIPPKRPMSPQSESFVSVILLFTRY
jgi:dual specificity tyrosine-phosphorylation-regulated kinase 2/3/4